MIDTKTLKGAKKTEKTKTKKWQNKKARINSVS